MGGMGSGRYGVGYAKGKDRVENRQAVSIGFFTESLKQTEETSFTFHFPLGRTKTLGSGRVHPNEMYIQFDYSDLVVRIYIDQTPCHYGGVRYWFKCPPCGRRSGKLYRYKLGLVCRKCCDLNYFSQQHTKTDCYYYQRRAEQIARKIDKDYKYSASSPSFPRKPKYMKWSAYEKLHRQFCDYSQKSYQVWLQGALSIIGMMGIR